MNFHSVSASGMVNVIRTTPLLSETSCGKKKADSFKFFRAVTWLRSVPVRGDADEEAVPG